MRNYIATYKYLDENDYNLEVINLLTPRLEGALSKEERETIQLAIQKLQCRDWIINHQEIKHIENHPSQLIRYIIFRYKFRFNSLDFVKTDFPIYLLIEPSSLCNLKCIMCFQKDDFFRVKNQNGFMDLQLFKKIIDEAVENGTGAITMASRGEPLLNKNINEMLLYTKGKFLEVKLNTNAVLLTDENIRAILNSEIDEVVFSVDSFKKEIYEKIRIGANFEKVLSNIKLFHEIRKKEFPSSKTQTRVSAVLIESLNDDLDIENKFVDFWRDYVDSVGYVKYSERDTTYENKDLDSILYKPCTYLWGRFYIWYDGTCNPCEDDYKSLLSPGNIKHSSIKDIWCGENMESLRKLHLKHRRQELDPCNKCTSNIG